MVVKPIKVMRSSVDGGGEGWRKENRGRQTFVCCVSSSRYWSPENGHHKWLSRLLWSKDDEFSSCQGAKGQKGLRMKGFVETGETGALQTSGRCRCWWKMANNWQMPCAPDDYWRPTLFSCFWPRSDSMPAPMTQTVGARTTPKTNTKTKSKTPTMTMTMSLQI